MSLNTQDVVRIELDKAGSISGRLVDEDGEPIKNAFVVSDYDKFNTQEGAAIWADSPKLIYQPSSIPTDKEPICGRWPDPRLEIQR